MSGMTSSRWIFARRVGWGAVAVGLLLVLGSAVVRAAPQVSSKSGTWLLENDRMQVVVAPQTGLLTVREKTGVREWKQVTTGDGGAGPRFVNIHAVTGRGSGVAFDWAFGPGGTNVFLVTLSLTNDEADLHVEVDMADRATRMDNVFFLEPFVLATPGAALVVADYCNGHLYPLGLKPFPRTWFALWEIDMPWVGVCDLQDGSGHAIIVDTPDDASIRMKAVREEGRELLAPQLGWAPSKRRVPLRAAVLLPLRARGRLRGSGQALPRVRAREQGLLVPFTREAEEEPGHRPAVRRAGRVGRRLAASSPARPKRPGSRRCSSTDARPPTDMKAINDLGYLTSDYDIYADMFQVEAGKEIDAHHGQVPGDVVLKADGERMKAWLTWDKKQYMKRCPARWVATAQVVIPKDLAQRPFFGRFIDVTTAEDLYECYDPAHPLTRGPTSAGQRRGVAGLRALARPGHRRRARALLGRAPARLHRGHDERRVLLVAGRALAPAQVQGPGVRQSLGRQVRQVGRTTRSGASATPPRAALGTGVPRLHRLDVVLGRRERFPAPGRARDHAEERRLQRALRHDPDALGQQGRLLADRARGVPAHLSQHLQAARGRCHAELLSHEFVTPDRAVQRTRFSDGTEVVVNFGEQPYRARLAGTDYLLPQNGFAVKGPRIEQSLALVDGKPLTAIRTERFQFQE